jgi:ADP-ribose pyrophosphatase YjhB (NUDIX family)
MNIERFRDRLKLAGILYVDVYAYHYTPEDGLEVALLKRLDQGELAGSFQPVSGKIHTGERIRHAFIRLVKEKLGVMPIELHKLDIVNTFYDDYYDTVMFVPCAAARLASKDVRINADHHTEARWLKPGEAASLLEWVAQTQCLEQLEQRVTGRHSFGEFHRLALDG